MRPFSFYAGPGAQLNPVFTTERCDTSPDLSNTPKLKEVVFRVRSASAEWTISALKTITPSHRNFHQITIHIPEHNLPIDNPTHLRETSAFREPFYGQWMDLDRLLVQFWELRGIRPKIVCQQKESGREAARKYTGCLFPEMSERGAVELVLRD